MTGVLLGPDVAKTVGLVVPPAVATRPPPLIVSVHDVPATTPVSGRSQSAEPTGLKESVSKPTVEDTIKALDVKASVCPARRFKKTLAPRRNPRFLMRN
jgi:hypothetical protein